MPLLTKRFSKKVSQSLIVSDYRIIRIKRRVRETFTRLSYRHDLALKTGKGKDIYIKRGHI
jgi:hypothetical protein